MRPLEDYQVDRPEVQGRQRSQLTGTNGRLLDRFYRSPSQEAKANKRVRFPKRSRRMRDGRKSGSRKVAVLEPRNIHTMRRQRCRRVGSKKRSCRLETIGRIFVGGHIGRVTPVPIPNTVVKPAKPMILLQRESRSLPALNTSPRGRKVSGACFV